MKNYELDKESSKNFVKEFKIKNGKIKVYFGNEKFNRGKWVLDKTDKNIEILLNKQENQVKKTNLQKIISNKIGENVIKVILTSTIGLVLVLAIIIKKFDTTMFFPIALGIDTVVLGISNLEIKKYKNLMSDLNKNKSFIDNKEKINQNIVKNNNTLTNVSKKTKKIAEKNGEININDMNRISSDDLKIILENIKKNEDFEFEYTESNEKGHQKTLK